MINGVIVRQVPFSSDARGWLLKAVPNEFVGDRPFGEIYLSGARPNEVKGAHYHERTVEWFCVIRGEGVLYLEEPNSGEKMALLLSRKNRLSVEIPPHVAHAILNVGEEEMILLAFADVPYDPSRPDTITWKLTDIPSLEG
jgi:dTDP-4-dehydrorhamnose 3,5-epimerase